MRKLKVAVPSLTARYAYLLLTWGLHLFNEVMPLAQSPGLRE